MRKLIMMGTSLLSTATLTEIKTGSYLFTKQLGKKNLRYLAIEQINSADCLVFGRVTYEGMATHWTREEGEIADLVNKIPKLVFSKTLKTADWNNTT